MLPAMWHWWDLQTRRTNPGASNASRYLSYNMPFYGDFTKMENASRNVQAYMDQYNLTWDDMWNTGNIPGAGLFADTVTRYIPGNTGRNFTSKNIMDLYKSVPYRSRAPTRINRRMSPELMYELEHGGW